MSRLAPGAVLVAVVAVGVGGLTVVAATDDRVLAFSPAIGPDAAVASLDPGETACQRQLDREAAFDQVKVPHLHARGTSPVLDVVVRDAASHRQLARGARAQRAGPLTSGLAIRMHPAVPEGPPIDVCITDAGPGGVDLVGMVDGGTEPTFAQVPGSTDRTRDIGLIFERSRPRSSLSQLPDVFDRASPFRPLGPWVYWLLLALLLVALPALLWRALAAAR